MNHFLSRYHYHLPEELIAQRPSQSRDHSRLLIVNRKTGHFSEIVFHELADFLHKGDSLVLNNTKVIPARLLGKKETGGKVEICLVEKYQENAWYAMTKPAKKCPPGTKIVFSSHLSCEVQDALDDGIRLMRFSHSHQEDLEHALSQHGQMALPHYIRRGRVDPVDAERYQTIYATHPGAIVAPTAGLHFTKDLLKRLSQKEIEQTSITLHVGPGTFRPVRTADIRQHTMHAEQYHISLEATKKLNLRSQHQRQICVGTTCCRALEAASNSQGMIKPGCASTDIFIFPGYQFKYVQSLLTNFHLPGSTLLMLVCAFAGYDVIMEAYAKAIKDRYRFYSYGDAMLIL